MALSSENPCQSCGACCSHFRVLFYWREAEPSDNPHPVPLHLVEDVSDVQRCMKGTNQKHFNRCEALHGKVGGNVGCTIYQNRPSPCRAFPFSTVENPNPRCDEARAYFGLPPLVPLPRPTTAAGDYSNAPSSASTGSTGGSASLTSQFAR